MLDVAECTRNPGTQYRFEEEQAIAPQRITGDEITFDPVRMQGYFEADEDGNVTVDGSLAVLAHGHCANCLSETESMVEGSFRETFMRDGDPEDDEIFSYSGHELSLEKLALTYIMLNLPMRFLCREGCVGLLTYAQGQAEPLTQKDESGRFPFAGLKDLLGEDHV